jgi:hypothetical protein
VGRCACLRTDGDPRSRPRGAHGAAVTGHLPQRGPQGRWVVENIDIWGRRRLAYEIDKNAEGIYAVVTLQAEPATVKELDRQLTLNESVLRTKVIRPDAR